MPVRGPGLEAWRQLGRTQLGRLPLDQPRRARRRLGGRDFPARHPRQRVGAGRHGQPCREARAGLAAEAGEALQVAQPTGAARRRWRGVGAALGEGPPRAGRVEATEPSGLDAQRHGAALPGQVARRPVVRLCTLRDETAHRGQDAERWHGVVTMVRWSGEGRIRWTSCPVGINGRRRFGKNGVSGGRGSPHVPLPPRNDDPQHGKRGRTSVHPAAAVNLQQQEQLLVGAVVATSRGSGSDASGSCA
jgi:hypothetical protein